MKIARVVVVVGQIGPTIHKEAIEKGWGSGSSNALFLTIRSNRRVTNKFRLISRQQQRKIRDRRDQGAPAAENIETCQNGFDE